MRLLMLSCCSSMNLQVLKPISLFAGNKLAIASGAAVTFSTGTLTALTEAGTYLYTFNKGEGITSACQNLAARTPLGAVSAVSALTTGTYASAGTKIAFISVYAPSACTANGNPTDSAVAYGSITLQVSGIVHCMSSGPHRLVTDD